jgi:hypothetical protein
MPANVLAGSVNWTAQPVVAAGVELINLIWLFEPSPRTSRRRWWPGS